MESISAVTARIGQIRAMLHPPSALPAPSTSRAAVTGAGAASGSAGPSAGPSFAAALAQAVAPAPVAPLPGAARPVAGPSTAASVAELKSTYANGRIPAEALTAIGVGGHRLAAPAAAAFADLQAAARREGVSFGVTDSYRSYDAQVDLAQRKGLYSRGGLAAEPGTSQHGWGLAVDLDLDPRAQAWMRTNAGRFGFVEDTPREPWHWAWKS